MQPTAHSSPPLPRYSAQPCIRTAHPGPAAPPPLQVLAKLPHLAGVLVTAGDKGAAYCFAAGKANHSGRVPVFDVNVADTTGAGAWCCAQYQLLRPGLQPKVACCCHSRCRVHCGLVFGIGRSRQRVLHMLCISNTWW
jgi:hypothetical protein